MFVWPVVAVILSLVLNAGDALQTAEYGDCTAVEITVQSNDWNSHTRCTLVMGNTFLDDVRRNKSSAEYAKHQDQYYARVHLPRSRGVCLTNVSKVTAISGIDDYIACTHVACKEASACSLYEVDEEGNVERQAETCVEFCAEKYLSCVVIPDGKIIGMFAPPSRENSMIGYGRNILFFSNRSLAHLGTGHYGLASGLEIGLGAAFSALTFLLSVFIVRFHGIDRLLNAISLLMNLFVRNFKGRTVHDSFLKGDTVVVWNSTVNGWKEGEIVEHIYRMKLLWRSKGATYRTWLDRNAMDNTGKPLVSSHGVAEWKKIEVGQIIEARPEGNWVESDGNYWKKCKVAEIKRIVKVALIRPGKALGKKVEFLLPCTRIRTVERHQSRLKKQLEKMKKKLKPANAKQAEKGSQYSAEEAEKSHGIVQEQISALGPGLRARKATLVFAALIVLRTGSFFFRLFKLLFNVMLMLQVVAMDEYARTTYAASLKTSFKVSLALLRLPDFSFVLDWKMFDLMFFPMLFEGHTVNNVCPGVVLSGSLLVGLSLCMLLYVMEQGNILFLAASAMEAIKHGRGKTMVSLINHLGSLSTGIILYAMIIFTNLTSSILYTLFSVVYMDEYTCGTEDTVVFYLSYVVLVVLVPFVTVLFIKAFSENKDDDHKMPAVEKVFHVDPKLIPATLCTYASTKTAKLAPSPQKGTTAAKASLRVSRAEVALRYVAGLLATILNGVTVLVKVTFGIWDSKTIEHYNILGKAKEFNSDSHQSVITVVAKSSTLFWLLFAKPMVVLAKLGEVTSDPPINFTAQKTLAFEDSGNTRGLNWALNLVTFALTVIVASFRTCAVFVTLVLWVVVLESVSFGFDVRTMRNDYIARQKAMKKGKGKKGGVAKKGTGDDGHDDDLEALARKKRYGF